MTPSETDTKPVSYQPDAVVFEFDAAAIEPEAGRDHQEAVSVQPDLVSPQFEAAEVQEEPTGSRQEPVDLSDSAPLDVPVAVRTEVVPESEASLTEPLVVPDENVAVPNDALPAQPEPAPAVDPAEVLRKRVYAGFAATVAVGLALAGLYIGGRLFAKPSPRSIEPVAVKTVESAVPQPVATVAAPVVAPSKTAVPAAQTVSATPRPNPFAVATPSLAPVAAAASVHPVLNFVTPQPGEKYLQLAALPPSFIDRYISELEAKGFHASVAPCPDENSRRILIGPFAERSALDKERAVLEAAGIQPILRFY